MFVLPFTAPNPDRTTSMMTKVSAF